MTDAQTPALKASVLVVDDDPRHREVFTRALADAGYGSTFADNTDKALDLLATGSHAVMLLTLQSQRINAYQILRRLKSGPVKSTVPVIVVSTASAVEGVAKTLEMGADDYILEPLHGSLLKTRIDDSLEQTRLRAQVEEHTQEMQGVVQDL